MNRLIVSFVIISTLLLSCTVDRSRNGKFDGMWHITKIEDIATGSVTDLSNEYYFWNVDTKLLEFRNTQSVASQLIMRFELKDNVLTLSEVHIYDRAGGDPLLTDTTLVYPYGMTTIPQSFSVKTLRSSEMYLESSEKRILFEKY